MRTAMLLLALALAAGCSRQGENLLGTAIVGGVLVGAALEDARNPRPMPGLSDYSGMLATPQPAPLAPERAVHEQDCSKPIENPGANLRCR